MWYVICDTWRGMFICDVTQACATWLSPMCHDSFICAMIFQWGVLCGDDMWRDIICDVMYAYVTWHVLLWHDACMCAMTHSFVPWRLNGDCFGVMICVVTYMHLWHDACMGAMTHLFVPWRLNEDCIRVMICDVTYVHMIWRMHVCHDSFICAMTSEWGVFLGDDMWRDIYAHVIWRMRVCHDPFVCAMTFLWRTDLSMGWLRLVGSLKLQVFFAKETYKRDDTLQKKPMISRNLLIVATP